MPNRKPDRLAADIEGINRELEQCARDGSISRLVCLLGERRRALEEAIGREGIAAEGASLLAGCAACSQRCLPALQGRIEATRRRMESVVRQRGRLRFMRRRPEPDGRGGRIVNGCG